MTTYIDFVPSIAAPFQFQPTLDGQLYSVLVPWNLYSQRYYVEVSDLSGNLICAIPQVGSPVPGQNPFLTGNVDLNLVAGYFTTSTLVWRPANQQFEVSP
jgi:hypothetical protein